MTKSNIAINRHLSELVLSSFAQIAPWSPPRPVVGLVQSLGIAGSSRAVVAHCWVTNQPSKSDNCAVGHTHPALIHGCTSKYSIFSLLSCFSCVINHHFGVHSFYLFPNCRPSTPSQKGSHFYFIWRTSCNCGHILLAELLFLCGAEQECYSD